MEEQNQNQQQPITTQGDAAEREENLGGTTNLSLEQLKKEGGIANPAEDNPDRLFNEDDLHEIQAGDDLDEPDTDDFDMDDEASDSSSSDAETNDDSTDGPVNPAELNS